MKNCQHFMVGVPVVGESSELIDVCEKCGLSELEISTPIIPVGCGGQTIPANPLNVKST